VSPWQTQNAIQFYERLPQLRILTTWGNRIWAFRWTAVPSSSSGVLHHETYYVPMQFRELSTPLHSVRPQKTRILNIVTAETRNVAISQFLTVESNTMEYIIWRPRLSLKDTVNEIQRLVFPTSSLSGCTAYRCRVTSNYVLYAAVPRFMSLSDTGFPDMIFIDFSLLRAYTGLLPEIKPQSLFFCIVSNHCLTYLLRIYATRSEILTLFNKRWRHVSQTVFPVVTVRHVGRSWLFFPRSQKSFR
jgi:hypothetical protein